MSAPAFPFVPIATRAFVRLQTSLNSKTRLEYLLAQLGWRARIDPADLAALNTVFNLNGTLNVISGLTDDVRHQRGDTLTVIETLYTTLKQLYNQVSTWGSLGPNTTSEPFNHPDFWSSLAQNLVPYLLVAELKESAPAIYALLFVTGIIEEQPTSPTGAARKAYTRIILHWDAIGHFLSDPVGVLATRYSWGAPQALNYQRVLGEFAALASLFPIRSRLSTTPAAIASKYYSDANLESQQIRSLILPFISGMIPDGSGGVEIGLSLTPIPAAAQDGNTPTGFLLAPYVHGGGQQIIALRSDLLLSFKEGFASDNAIGAEIRPGSLTLESDPGSTAIGAEISLVGSPATPIRFFGTDETSRLELTGYALSVGVTGTLASPELLIRAGTALAGGSGRLVLYLEPSDGDSFMAQAFGPDPVKLEVGAAFTWSSRTGLGIDGAVGLHIQRAPNKKIGPLTFHDYSLDIEGQTSGQGNKPLTAALTLGASLQLGPVTATVEKIGVTFQLTTLSGSQKGLLDNLDVHWGFKGPSGVGIKVQSDVVTGGGYLYFDPDHHKYAGVAQLTLKLGEAGKGSEINLSALGILQTQLPNNPDAYSLVLLIAATFTPIQLGLGFTLNGLGGLAGVNRAADLDYLRGVVRNGQLDTLLFPADVMSNPAAALAIVDAAYPAAEGRYLIGLMARVGWGTPTLLTLDLALILELPAPLRIIMLGVLQASLPSKTNELLKLRADFLGYVDFGAKTAAFDASLTQSKLLMFSLTGDMAFRLYQGNNPLFVITAGGFHPAFQPPAGTGLTGLRRLTLALSQGNDLRLTLASYFAVTANTVQFGSRLDLAMRIGLGLRAEGNFSFDVLFQFSPFRVLAHVEAGVSILSGSRELLGLHLSLDVTGPGPWHIWGDASFRIWFVRVSVGVNATIGQAPDQPQLPAPDVHSLLKPALENTGSWQVEAPVTQAAPGGVVMRPVAATAGQLFLDPRATLVLRQRVAPLGLILDKYGSGPTLPINGRRFDLSELTLNGQGGTPAPAADVEVVRDFFAPDQFVALTDAQRLSLPSFQLLPSGLRLKRLTSLKGATVATRRVVRYEYKSLGSSPQRIQRPLGTGQFGQFQQLLKGGALGRAVAAEQPAARAAQPVGWAEDSYAVVHATDLSYYADAINPAYNYVHDFATQIEAEQARQALVQARPNLAAEVLVVPSYERATV